LDDFNEVTLRGRALRRGAVINFDYAPLHALLMRAENASKAYAYLEEKNFFFSENLGRKL